MRTEQGQPVRLADYAPPAWLVPQVELLVRLAPTATEVEARLHLRRNPAAPADAPLRLDGEGLHLVSVAVDGVPLAAGAYALEDGGLHLPSPPADAFVLDTVVRIDPTANTQLSGLYRSGGNYCTQCEAEGFRRITFFPDRPDVMAVWSVRLEAARNEAPTLLSNGNPGASGPLPDGRHFAEWHDPHPKPAYLFALVGGDFDTLEEEFRTREGRAVRLAIHVQKGRRERAAWAMDSLVRSMRWDEERFGRLYDLDVFNIVAVPDFNMGAMENKGLNIFNDRYILADPDLATDGDHSGIERVVAHEYFHNWTGNRITCRDWFQLCLKEGLTVWRDQQFCADQRSAPVQRLAEVRTLRANQFPEDAGPLAHAVRPETYREINNFYTATVYEKGAELIGMIATLLGEARFRAGMDLYFERHDGQAATVEQFIACFEEAGGRDLSQFMAWYGQAGTPRIHVESAWDEAAGRLTLALSQSQPATPGQTGEKAPLLMPLRIGLIGSRSREALTPASVAGAPMRGEVVELSERRHTLVFEGLPERPVLSLNRGFSAPVILEHAASSSDLLVQVAADSDPFNRAEAFQASAMAQLVAASRAIARGGAPRWRKRWLALVPVLAADPALEPAYRATLLSLPSEGEIAQAAARNVDPDAVHRAHRALLAEMGALIAPSREAIVAAMDPPGPYSPDAASAGRRALANLLLSLAVAAGEPAAIEAIRAQARQADNMTDREAALYAIVQFVDDEGARAEALDAFEARHRRDPLAYNKWFTAQALQPGHGAPARVAALLTRIEGPRLDVNRMRALLGSFAMANLTGFNAPDGSGYRLLADAVQRLDSRNPQVAARMLTAFRSFTTMEPGRRALARKALRSLARSRTLSRDVSDILERSLATGK